MRTLGMAWSLSCGDDGDQDRWEIHNYGEGYDHDDDKDKEYLNGADDKKGRNDVDTIMLGNCKPAIESTSPTIKD